MFNFLKNMILSLIYPSKCVFCEKITERNNLICTHCEENIKINTSVQSLIEFESEKITHCVSPFKYEDKVKDAVCRFKFYGHKDYAEFFSEIVASEINKNISNIKFDFISAVPLSVKRQSQRGYNQSKWLAEVLSKKLGVPYKETLVKTEDNLPQHELPFNQRIKNVMGVYRSKGPQNIKNKNILLCDDIITTGNTLKECVKVLKYSGAKNVICCTVAYV